MRELVDSSALADDPEALRARFARDGYLYLPGLLPERDVHGVFQDELEAIASAGWTRDGRADRTAYGELRVEGQDGWSEGYAQVQRLESMHRLAHAPRLTSVLERLFGEPALVHPRKVARFIWPDPEVTTTAPHQDHFHIQGSTDLVTVWIPLHDCPPHVGGLKVLERSWSMGLQPVKPMAGAGRVGAAIEPDHPDWATTDFHVGDAIVFHCFTVHAGQPNTSDGLRISVDFRYQPRRTPITASSLLPHHHPDVPDWPELTEGWESTRWIEVPEDVQIVDVRYPTDAESLARWHLDLDPAPSRLLAATA